MKVFVCMFVDFQKIAANIHEFQLKLSEDADCAEVRDALNFALLQLQRYFRLLRSRTQQQQQQQQHGDNILTQSLHSLSSMTSFRDAPDQFVWRWIDVDAVKDGSSIRTPKTLPAPLDKETSSLPAVIRAARNSDNNALVQLIEHGNFFIIWWMYFCANVTDASLGSIYCHCHSTAFIYLTFYIYNFVSK